MAVRLGLVQLALGDQQHRHVVDRGQRVRVLRAQLPPPGLERALLQRLRLVIQPELPVAVAEHLAQLGGHHRLVLEALVDGRRRPG